MRRSTWFSPLQSGRRCIPWKVLRRESFNRFSSSRSLAPSILEALLSALNFFQNRIVIARTRARPYFPAISDGILVHPASAREYCRTLRRRRGAARAKATASQLSFRVINDARSYRRIVVVADGMHSSSIPRLFAYDVP